MSAVADNGGPAFPQINQWDPDRMGMGQSGMTLRDYAAVHAAVGIMQMVAAKMHDIRKFDGMTPEASIAMDAYKFADAMLKARKP